MSNSLAIAATTATLRSLLMRAGTLNVTVKPIEIANKDSGRRVNLCLYQTTINGAWRNRDMPNKVRAGETGQPPLPLCLYYLITAYSEDEDETKAQQVLGKAMSILHDHPLLGANEIEEATETDVAGSDLHEQIERIRITPQPLSLEEISKLWAAFQASYRLSTAYEVSVVLIESTRPTRTPLPVLRRGEDDRDPIVQAGLILPFPEIEHIILPQARSTAQLNDQVILSGHHFALENGNPDEVTVTVQLRSTRLPDPILVSVPPDERSATEIRFKIPHRTDAFYPAGLYRVSASIQPTSPPSKIRVTNEFPLTLAPMVTQLNGSNLPPPPVPRVDDVGGFGDVTLRIQCEPDVLPGQSAELLIGDRAVSTVLTERTDIINFEVKQIAAGTYRLRLRIDGVDSPIIDFSDPTHPKFDDSQQVEIE
jgi:hypothetical protein